MHLSHVLIHFKLELKIVMASSHFLLCQLFQSIIDPKIGNRADNTTSEILSIYLSNYHLSSIYSLGLF